MHCDDWSLSIAEYNIIGYIFKFTFLFPKTFPSD